MFSNALILLATFMVSGAASATTWYAAQYGLGTLADYGLTADSGYVRTTDKLQDCVQGRSVLVDVNGFENTEFIPQPKITNCDGTPIGWVEQIVKAGELVSVPFGSEIEFGIQRTDKTFPDNVIYFCNAKDRPEIVGNASAEFFSTNPQVGVLALNQIQGLGLKFKVQLYFNEFDLSGKCIGKIEILD